MKKKDPTSHRIIEKRRRDRMNNCLADLSKLIPSHYIKKGRGRIEKTEIIEMTIKHLKHLMATNQPQQQHQPQLQIDQNCKKNDNITNGSHSSADSISDETNSRSQNAAMKQLGYSIDKCCVRCSSSESGSSSGSESSGFINNPRHTDSNISLMSTLDRQDKNNTIMDHNSSGHINNHNHHHSNNININNQNANNMSLMLLSEEEKKKYFEFGFHQCLLRLSQYMINELDWPLFNNNYKNCNDQKQIALFTDHLVSQLNNYAQNLKVLAHRTTSMATVNLSSLSSSASSDHQSSPFYGFKSTATTTTTTTPPPTQQSLLMPPGSSLHSQQPSRPQIHPTPTPPTPIAAQQQQQQLQQQQHQQQQPSPPPPPPIPSSSSSSTCSYMQQQQSTNHQLPLAQSLHKLVILTPSPATPITPPASTSAAANNQTDNQNNQSRLDFKCSFRSFKKGMTDRFQRGAQFS